MYANVIPVFAIVSHELAHLASYRATIEPGRGKFNAVVGQRSGMSPIITTDGAPHRLFAQFNEGLTELVAHEIRRRMVGEIRHLLEPAQAERLINHHSYPAEVHLVCGLLQTVSATTGRGMRPTLLRDYFGRTQTFLSKLAALKPGAVGRLACLTDLDSLLAYAEWFGLETAARRIRRVMNIRIRR